MADIAYWEPMGELLFKSPDRFDFISPASQSVLRKWDHPLWESAAASRCTTLPMWARPDIFRTINYQDAYATAFSPSTVTFPTATVTPSGVLSTGLAERPVKILWSDRELYHHDVQKVFSIFIQFDLLMTHQVAAIAGLSLEETQKALNILYSSEVIEKSDDRWAHKDTMGPIWKMNYKSLAVTAYHKGMDALTQLLTTGGPELFEIPPGTGTRSTVKHNLFTAEIVLRLAEAGDNIIGMWGDTYASESLFHTHRDDVKQRASHGDAILVTKDGTIIILEVVGSLSNDRRALVKIIEKAASWVGVIANSPLDINVLFVDTTWHTDRRDIINAIEIGVSKESAAYVIDNHMREKASDHIGVANAAWWFPEDGTISQAGTRLAAYMPSYRKFKEFDIPDLGFSSPDRRRDVVVNTVSALHTPPWIRGDIIERDFNAEVH